MNSSRRSHKTQPNDSLVLFIYLFLCCCFICGGGPVRESIRLLYLSERWLLLLCFLALTFTVYCLPVNNTSRYNRFSVNVQVYSTNIIARINFERTSESLCAFGRMCCSTIKSASSSMQYTDTDAAMHSNALARDRNSSRRHETDTVRCECNS